jgi:charged multivesicular body protein 4
MALLRLFGAAPAEPPKLPAANPQSTMDQLRETVDMTDKRIHFLEIKVQKELVSAKELASKNQRAALMCLKRKKMYETQIERLRGAALTIETQLGTIEASATNSAILDAVTQGARTLSGLNRNMNVDTVEETMDDIKEQMETAEEIGKAISSPIGGMYDLDEGELEDELNLLLESDLADQFEEIHLPDDPSPLPSVPSTAIASPGPPKPRSVQEEEDEFAALGAEMGFGF